MPVKYSTARLYLSFFFKISQPLITCRSRAGDQRALIFCLRQSVYSVLVEVIRLISHLITLETTLMITTIPPIGILIDLPFGVLMWTSIAHFLLTLVMKEDSSFIILRVLRGVNSPIHRAINLLKPSFIITRLALLYCALALFILRYYILPLLIGFDVWNFYDMPLESLLLSAKTDLGF